jgi:hypothetical protein
MTPKMRKKLRRSLGDGDAIKQIMEEALQERLAHPGMWAEKAIQQLDAKKGKGYSREHRDEANLLAYDLMMEDYFTDVEGEIEEARGLPKGSIKASVPASYEDRGATMEILASSKGDAS